MVLISAGATPNNWSENPFFGKWYIESGWPYISISLLSEVIKFNLYHISKAVPSTRLVQVILRIVLSFLCQCFKKIYDVCRYETAKLRLQHFNPLVCMRWTVSIRSLTALFIIMISPEIALHFCYNIFSSVRLVLGTTLRFETSKYKSAMTFGSLFDWTIFNRRILRLWLSMAPWIGDPKGFSLS